MAAVETQTATTTFPELAPEKPAEEPLAAWSGPIIFFDGVCGLCNTSVDRVMKWDRHSVFRFAPLQGETARKLLPLEYTQQLDSLSVRVDGRIYRKSSGVVQILWRLGVLSQIAGTMLWLFPRPIRDWGYRVVARNRYRWFGKKETCRLPTPAERQRFLP